MTYVHLQIVLSSEDTVQAKKASEAYTQLYRVMLIHYHADNGRFSNNFFLQVVTQENQTISYCGVNCHFQNRKAEKFIRDFQEQTRKQIFHAKVMWTSAIELELWLYVLRQATYPFKLTTWQGRRLLTNIEVLKHQCRPQNQVDHSFGCPVYALQNRLQSGGGGVPKWQPSVWLGMKSVPSPRHAVSVSLILNLQTSVVLP